ncbi:MAG: CHAT domain-containing protein [Scytonema sp. PMC 1070.18]|nr:CHAT domain-containing protein [Scytonema sp. PMC 1070.18]
MKALKSLGTIFLASAIACIPILFSTQSANTVTLMNEFYGNLSKNMDKAGALRQAMLETMKKYPNSSDWAAFTLIGLL